MIVSFTVMLSPDAKKYLDEQYKKLLKEKRQYI
jgi:hypothetical protein